MSGLMGFSVRILYVRFDRDRSEPFEVSVLDTAQMTASKPLALSGVVILDVGKF